jgi:uncharacterized membrane protein YphA (DoxX/SURF4 family)
MKQTTIVEIITVLFVILFLYTGIAKLMDYTLFREQLAVSPILAPVATLVATTLPWIEFAIVILLIVPRWRLKGLKASAVIMTLFTLYIVAMMAISKDLPCSCGGIIELMSWNQHLIFNIVSIGLAAWGVMIERKLKKEQRQTWNLLTPPVSPA